MKARVKSTGEIVDAEFICTNSDGKEFYEIDNSGYTVTGDELDFELTYQPDYWTRLKHQYAGMAMQGMLSNAIGFDEVRRQAAENGISNLITLIAGAAMDYATALIEKLKENKV